MSDSIKKYLLIIYLFSMLFLNIGSLFYLWDKIPTETTNENVASNSNTNNNANTSVNQVNANKPANVVNSNANATNANTRVTNSNSNVANANTNQVTNTNQATNLVNSNANSDANSTNDKKLPFLWWEFGKKGQILLLLLFAGSLGAVIRCFHSFFTLMGVEKFNYSWIWYYIILPFTGGALSLVFYFVIRGGFFRINNDTDVINLYSFTGLAMLIGLFSDSALTKLKEVAETIFGKAPDKTKKDNNPKNPSGNSNDNSATNSEESSEDESATATNKTRVGTRYTYSKESSEDESATTNTAKEDNEENI